MHLTRRIFALAVFTFFILPTLAGPVGSAEPCPGAGHGRLLIHGGGKSSDDYTRRGLELCGGVAAHVVLVPYAGVAFDKPETVEEGAPGSKTFTDAYSKLWREAGAKAVTVLNFDDPDGSVAAVKHADYIFFGGGDQVELMRWIEREPRIMSAIKEQHVKGALIGGMSAGAAAMPRLMIAGGDTADVTSIRSGGTLISPGLGFWPEVITDQHFVKRQRFARLVSAVLDHPKFPGVAIDEATTILVSEHEFEVFGLGSVIVFDARRASVKAASKGQNQSATGIRMSVLRAGDRFAWR
jgi:cyanophycinase